MTPVIPARLIRTVIRLAGWLLGLLLLLLMTAAGVLGLMATETGTRWLARGTTYLVPGELSLGRIHGTLLGRLELEQVRYHLFPYQVELDRLTLAWQPETLFSGRLVIEEVTTAGLHYTGPAPVETEPAPLILPAVRLPLTLVVEHAELTGTEIIQGEARQTIDRLTLAAEQTEDRLTLQTLEARIAPWELTAVGQARLSGAYPLTLTVNWRGTIEGQSLAGHGELTGSLDELVIDHRLTAPFQITTGGTLNVLAPELPFALHGTWKDLGWPPLTPDYRSPEGNYRVRGTLSAYRIELNVLVTGKALPQVRVHLNGHGSTESLTLAPLTVLPPRGRLTATGKVHWTPAVAWQLTLEGHDLDPQPFAPDWPGRLEIAASSGGRWDPAGLALRLHIQRLQGSLREHPVEAAGTLEFKHDQWRFTGVDVRSNANRIQLHGRYGRQMDLAFSVDGRNLASLWPGLDGTLKAQGKLAGSPTAPWILAEASGRRLAWRENRLGVLELSLRFAPDDPSSHSDLHLRQLRLPGQAVERLDLSARGGFDHHRLNLDLHAPQGRLAAVLAGSYQGGIWQARIEQVRLQTAAGRQLAFPGDGILAAEGRLDFNPTPARAGGRVKVELPDLSRLAPWLPQLDRPEGQLSAELHLGGPVDNPNLQGYLRLSGAAAGIRAAGIRLTAIEATVSGNTGRIDLTGSLRSGQGYLDFSGWAQPPARLHLALRGRDLEVARRTQARVAASPDLAFDLDGRTGHLQGRITIPRADIRLRELPQGSVTVSDDEVIVGTGAEPPPPPFQLTSRLELVLGEQVRFQGFGLRTGLAGSLEIRSRNAQASAFGAIDLKEGVYKAYGQNLTLAKGRLIFNGPVDRPYLELKAIRTIQSEGVTAMLEVRGPAQKPILQVKSQPPLPETEALAYLLTGRSFKSGGAADQTLVAKAALSMGMDLALPWIKKLGLDEVAMQTGATLEETSLTLGKYLTPDLYVGYAFNLFNGIGQALLRYQLNRFFRIEAGAGASQSIDLFYTLETD